MIFHDNCCDHFLALVVYRESGWPKGYHSRLLPPRTRVQILGFARGLRFVDLNLTPRVFLQDLRFSSLLKIDFHAKILCRWLGRLGNHSLRVKTLNKVIIYLFIYFIYLCSNITPFMKYMNTRITRATCRGLLPCKNLVL